ncbi:MAG: CheY-like chemotaxis protein [Mariniblastus sp.]|jgi:CheY-like chemotaxis protein
MTNILIVDDTDVDLLLMERLLSAPEFTIVTAGDGQQALDKIGDWSIELILTDLQMPKMDGLELVRAVREKYPHVPVILTTGQGSEDIAAEALLAGASSYIPKNKLSGMLLSTVKEVLEILHASQSFDELVPSFGGSKFQFELKTDPTLVPKFVDLCQLMLQSLTTLDRTDRLRIAIAVDQALNNALYRGNLELGSHHRIEARDFAVSESVEDRLSSGDFAERKIDVVFEVMPGSFGIRITDEGQGFDTSSVGTWDEPAYRGIILMNSFMDSVNYNDKGNSVEMHFQFDKSNAPDAAEADPEPAMKVPTLTCRRSGKSVALTKPKIVIGSRTGCHIKLKSDTVAALHCTLNMKNDEWVLVVLSKKHVTLLNSQEVESSVLSSGDVLQIGDREFKFEV